MKPLDNPLGEFYQSLEGISIVNSDLDGKRNNLKQEVFAFNDSIQNIKINSSISKQNKEMAELLNGTVDLIKESSQSWINNFEELLRKEKFRSDLANYFIVMIFGKVKAGKSSLGNFIAEHRPRTQKIEFFKYDEAGNEQAIRKLKEINTESFATHNLECTIEIQGFKLDGMAWIDTPGLGSMTPKNGRLAKEYIQAADYIIYPTSSDSPLQMDEKKQLKELFEQNKKVTICITKSDETEEDECECGSEEGCSKCDGGVVRILKNKSSDVKKQQEDHVKENIDEIIQSMDGAILGDIISISTHAAQLGLKENDEKLFANSNILKFYELITEVVKEKSTKLNEGTPYAEIKSFIDNTVMGNNDQPNSIRAIKKALDDLNLKINESIERFKTLQSNTASDLESEIENIVEKYYSQIDETNSKDIFKKIDDELHGNIATIIQGNVREIFTEFDASLNALSASFEANEFEIEDRYREIVYSTEEKNKKIGSSLFAIGASLGVGLLTGGASIVAEIATVAVAGLAGSYLGGKIGEATGSTQIEKIKVGNNKDEVIQKFKHNRAGYYKKVTRNAYQGTQDTFFVPLKTVVEKLDKNIGLFEKKIDNIL